MVFRADFLAVFRAEVLAENRFSRLKLPLDLGSAMIIQKNEIENEMPEMIKFARNGFMYLNAKKPLRPAPPQKNSSEITSMCDFSTINS